MRRTVDGLAATKMNVLHWHIYDGQSFPMEVPAFPALTDAAYSDAEAYSPQDIRDLVNYAYQRGVRIIPEFGELGRAPPAAAAAAGRQQPCSRRAAAAHCAEGPNPTQTPRPMRTRGRSATPASSPARTACRTSCTAGRHVSHSHAPGTAITMRGPPRC